MKEYAFHPDDDFNDYITLKNGKPVYSNAEAEIGNGLMKKCFIVCEKHSVDIYDFMLEVSLKETGLDKHIPLPSAPFSENE